MAHIKCRYFDLRCNYLCGMNCGNICSSPEFGDDCPNDAFTDHRFDEETLMHFVSNYCLHAVKDFAEFEGDFKSYEFDSKLLHVRYRYIETERIVYLEIDGRILINDTHSTT